MIPAGKIGLAVEARGYLAALRDVSRQGKGVRGKLV